MVRGREGLRLYLARWRRQGCVHPYHRAAPQRHHRAQPRPARPGRCRRWQEGPRGRPHHANLSAAEFACDARGLRRAIPRALQTRTEAAPFVTTPDAGARLPADYHESLAMDLRDTIRTYGFLSGSYDFVFGPVFHPGRKEAVRAVNDRPGQRILEVGVGTGLSLPHFRRDSEVTGIDVSPEMLKKARGRSEALPHVKALHVMDAERLDFEDNSFDAVLALYVASVVSSPA